MSEGNGSIPLSNESEPQKKSDESTEAAGGQQEASTQSSSALIPVRKYATIKDEYLLSPERITLRALSEKYGVSLTTIFKHSQKGDWPKLREEEQNKIKLRYRRLEVDKIARRMARDESRRRRYGRHVAKRGFDALRERKNPEDPKSPYVLKPQTAREAARLVEVGTRIERKERGNIVALFREMMREFVLAIRDADIPPQALAKIIEVVENLREQAKAKEELEAQNAIEYTEAEEGSSRHP